MANAPTSAQNHTDIIKALIEMQPTFPRAKGSSTAAALNRASKRPGAPAAMAVAAAEVRTYEALAKKVNLKNALFTEARQVLIPIALFRGEPKELLLLLKSLSAKRSPSIKTGLAYARDIVTAGEDSIYNPEFWVVASAVWPADVFLHGLGDAADDVLGKAKKVLVDDAVGAVVGGIVGGINGGAKGAAKGAASGAVKASADSVT